jgi:hypothetical protein
MSETILEQKCLNCGKKETYDVKYSAFYCNKCTYEKRTIDEGLDFELFECLKCKNETGRDGISYWTYSRNYVDEQNLCGECEKICPIIEIEDEKELVNCKICNIEFVKVSDDNYGYSHYNYNNWCINCEKIQRKIDQRKNYLENVKRLKALAQNRELDVFPDQFVKIIKVTDDEYDHWDAKSEKDVYKIVTQKEYEFLCGYRLPIVNYDLTSAKQKHLVDDKCIPCKVLAGKSKANTMTQDHVATLFKKGVFGKHTKLANDGWSRSANYYSEHNESRTIEGKHCRAGKLIHYSTTEGLRTFDGKTIGNLQCWSAGFAKCSLHSADYRLPISTLETIYSDGDLFALTVIEESEALHATLFKVKDDYLVYGHDLVDHSRYLVKIPKSAQSVQEALDSLKPENARIEGVQRQGDIFFVPTNIDVGVPDSYTASWYELENALYPMREFLAKRFNIPYDSEKDSWYDVEKQVSENLSKLKPHEVYQIELDYAKANKRKILQKEKRNDRILETNHLAENLKVINGVTYVKGKITHGREQHTKFILESWHIAVKNLAVESWQVSDRDGRGGGD